jgi:hypothetical protein
MRDAAADPPPLVVAGPPASAAALARALARDGDRDLVRERSVAELRSGVPARAATLVYIVKDELTPTDEHVLRAASRHRIPVVCLLLGDGAAYRTILPTVLATSVVRAQAVDEAAAEAVAERVAARDVEAAWPLAARLPRLKRPVLRALAGRTAVRAAVAGVGAEAGAFPSGVVLVQVRMLLRIAAVWGVDPARAALFAVAGAAGAELGLAALTRRLLGRPVPLAAHVVDYAGTRALGRVGAALLELRA